MSHKEIYAPSKQALELLIHFLDPQRVEISARELAELTSSPESAVRECLAPVVGHGVLIRRRDDLTGEVVYLTGLMFRTVSHLLEQPEVHTDVQPEASLDDQPEGGLATVAELGAAEVDKSEVPAPPASAFEFGGKVGDDGIYYRRGDQFLAARDQGSELLAPPGQIKRLADSARRWVKRYAPGYQVRMIKQLPDRAEGAVYLVKRLSEVAASMA